MSGEIKVDRERLYRAYNDIQKFNNMFSAIHNTPELKSMVPGHTPYETAKKLKTKLEKRAKLEKQDFKVKITKKLDFHGRIEGALLETTILEHKFLIFLGKYITFTGIQVDVIVLNKYGVYFKSLSIQQVYHFLLDRVEIQRIFKLKNILE
jgi:hypothetical protein